MVSSIIYARSIQAPVKIKTFFDVTRIQQKRSFFFFIYLMYDFVCYRRSVKITK